MRIPKLRLHPKTGQAFTAVQKNGERKFYYHGKWGTPEAETDYKQWLARHMAGVPHPEDETCGKKVAQVVSFYLDWIHDEGLVSEGEHYQIRHTLDVVCEHYGSLPVEKFSAEELSDLRKVFQSRYTHRTATQKLGRIKKMFRKCLEKKKSTGVTGEQVNELLLVEGGHNAKPCGRHSREVPAVAWTEASKLMPFLSPVVSALCKVQFLCGLRPTEACVMTLDQMDMSGDIWTYQPDQQKTGHRGWKPASAVPPVAQKILEPFLDRAPSEFLFKPAEAVAWKMARDSYYRTTKVYPSEVKRVQAARKKRKARGVKRAEHYTASTYGGALKHGFRAAEEAGLTLERWSPNQLRHGIATLVAHQPGLGQEAAQAYLGHAHLSTTQVYVEKQKSKVISVATELEPLLAELVT